MRPDVYTYRWDVSYFYPGLHEGSCIFFYPGVVYILVNVKQLPNSERIVGALSLARPVFSRAGERPEKRLLASFRGL